jgi:hypothetical protein
MASMLDAHRSGIGGLAKLGEGVRANPDVKTQAGLSRGANQSKKLNNDAWTETFPAQGASLDLDFVNDRGYVRGVGQGSSLHAVTFTRASSASFVGSDGLLKQYSNQGALGNNLLTFPQDFDNAIWTKNNVIVIANAEIAPDGTLTADRIEELGNTPLTRYVQFSASGFTTNDQTLTYSVHLKAKEFSWALLYFVQRDGVTFQSAYFNLTGDGTVGTKAGNPGTNISNEGNDWYRCSITVNTGTGGSAPLIRNVLSPADGANQSFTANQEGIFIWGAQLEFGSTATEYFPTNVNQPRFDWASIDAVAQRNIYPNTEAINSTNWRVVTGTLIPNQPDPFGGNNASLLEMTATNASIDDFNKYYGSFGGVTQTVSIFVKANPANPASTFTLYFQNGTATFNLSTGEAGAVTNVTPYTDDIGNGWFRIGITGVKSNVFWYWGYQANGTAGNGAFIYGLQLENANGPPSPYQANGAFIPAAITPLRANPTVNGLLMEETRTNRLLWCRDATKIVGTNFILYSQDFDNNTNWITTNTTVSANTIDTIDPFNQNMADKLIADSTPNAVHNIRYNNALNGDTALTHSVYLKAAEYTKCAITFSSITFSRGVRATVDLSAGTLTISYIGTGAGTHISTISDAGNGWWRISFSGVIFFGTAYFYIDLLDASGNISFTGNGVDGIYVYGAQTNPSLALLDYTKTEASTTIGWSKSGELTTTKNQIGIDGVANAASLLTAISANAVLVQPVSANTADRTSSVYLKRITGTGPIQVSIDGGTYSTVDLSTTEWRRIVLTGSVASTSVGIRIVTIGDSVAMDFAQVEDGLLVSTPIMTTSAAAGVARASDIATMTGNNFDGWMSEFGTITGNHLYFYTGDGGQSPANALGSPCAFGTAGTANQFQPLVLNNTSSRTRWYAGYYRNAISGGLTIYESGIDNSYPGNVFLSWAARIQHHNYGISLNSSNELSYRGINSVTIKSRFIIGGNAQTTGFNGYIKYLKFFPTPKNETSLKILSGSST